jgi:hypothetical protein
MRSGPGGELIRLVRLTRSLFTRKARSIHPGRDDKGEDDASMESGSWLIPPKLNCHPDRSVAEWRDLRFLSPYASGSSSPMSSCQISGCSRIKASIMVTHS